jgi:GAF domain-containing protein
MAKSPDIEKKLQQREAELAVINSVQTGLLAHMEMQEIYDLVGDQIRNLFDAQVAVVSTFSYSDHSEHFQYAFEDGERHNLDPRPIDKLRQRLIDTAELICINENADEEWTRLTGEEPTVAPGTKLTKSALYVPMVAGTTVSGYISLQNVDREHAFSESDIRLLSTLANSISVALEMARLFNETEQRNAELAVINSVQEGLVAELDIQGIYDLVGDRVRDLFDSQVVHIASFNYEAASFRFDYIFEDGQRYYPEPQPIDGLRRHLIENRELILINENLDPAMEALLGETIPDVPGTEAPKAAVYVPMLVGDRVRGYISLQNLDREHAFDASAVRLLGTLANSMSVALENARLFDETNRLLGETEQRNAELAVINSVQEGLVAELDIQGIYDLVGDRIRDIFDAQSVVVRTFDLEQGAEFWRYSIEKGARQWVAPRPLDGFSQHMLRLQAPLVVNEGFIEFIGQFSNESAVEGETPKSAVFVPLRVGDAVTGNISLQNVDQEGVFCEADVRLLSTLANSMSVALENARLFDETNRLLAETEQRNAELAVINSVQEGLVAELDIQGIYDLVGDRVRDLFDSQVVNIVTFNYEADSFQFDYLFEDGQRYYPEPQPIDGLRRHLIENRELILINENLDAALETLLGETIPDVPGTEAPKAAVYVPMLIGDRVRGYISLQNLDREHAFNEADVRLLSTLANSMSVALENARLFNETTRLLGETEQRNAELAVINRVQEGLVAEMDLQGIYDLVGDKIRDLFDSQVTVIAEFDHDSQKEHFHYVYEDGERFYPAPRFYDGVRKSLINTQKLIHINENAIDELKKYGTDDKPAPGTKFPKSMVYEPLILGDTVRGYVSLQNLDREHAFSDSDVRLLHTLANSMSVALENARLFNETEQRNAELAVINSVQEGLVAEMNMQGIYDLVGDKIRDLFDAQVAFIATFDHENKTEKFQYLFENGKRYYPDSRPYDKIRQRLIKTQKLIWINENSSEAYTTITGEAPVSVPGTKFAKSMVFVPLVIGDSVRGYVSLQNVDRELAFSESDVRLLSTLANSMSVALENARLFNETEQRNAELAVINSVQQGLVAEMDMQGIYDLVGERIRTVFDAQVAGIVTFDLDSKTEHFAYLFEDGDRLFPNPRPYDKVREKIIIEKKTLLINDNANKRIAEINGQPHKAVPGTKTAKSALYVPMVVGDSVRGYVSLQNLDREHAFSDSDVRLLNTLVNSMSVALENARLFNETTRLLAETEQRNAELAVINSVQEGLVREMDMEAIYSLVGNRICDVLHTQTMAIRTFDHENGTEHWVYAIENGERLYIDSAPFIWANRQVIKSKEPLLINENYLETSVKYGGTGVTKGMPPKSAIFVPMIVGNKVMGSVSLQNVEKEKAFTDSDVRLLTTLTNSMSVALENARLFNETTRLLAETEQRAAELHTVNHISRAMVTQLEFDALIKLVGDLMKDTFKADIVYLALHDRETNMLNFPYFYGDTIESRPFENGITEKIILNREPLLINHSLESAYEEINADKKGEMVDSYLGVPIISGNNSIGVISVQSKGQENRFSEYDQRLLTTIAANVGVAMQNAEAYQKLRSALDDLKAAQEQLVQQEKLASLGQLTAGIAHEIKNPLNFVNNFSEVSAEMVDEMLEDVSSLRTKLSGNGVIDKSEIDKTLEDYQDVFNDIKSNLRKIHDHGTRADGIVKSMLLHSRGGDGRMEPTDLNSLVKEYVNLSFHGMRAAQDPINVDIDLQLDETVGEVPLITEDFSRIILNLSGNAFDAMRGHITLTSAQGIDYHPKLSVRTRAEGRRVNLEIEDNGPGIPDNIKDKILQPFFTTKKGTQGTGLGLSITHDIIKAHGGEMEIRSSPGSTVFRICLNR